jgi:RHS repeat-associated protein
LYDASGVKHKATYYAVNPMQIPLGATTTENTGTNLSQSSYTDYCGNYVYENGKIKRILTPEWYIEAAGAIPMNYIPYWSYNYLLKDHLGNTRLRLYGNYISAKSPILNNYGGAIDYYPFGMEIEKVVSCQGLAMSYINGTVTPYLYNGKEMDRMNGLNEYDYGARWRDAAVGNGWNTMDPLAEKYYSTSPYAYCLNNSVNKIDPDGRWVPDSEGNLIAEEGDDAESLAKFQNFSYDDALEQLQNEGYTTDKNDILNLDVGDVLNIDNVYTESIDNSSSQFTTDVMMGLSTISGSGPGIDRGALEDNYNCWGSVIAGTQDNEIKNGVGINDPKTFDNDLKSDYKPVNQDNAVFDKTVVHR